MYLYLKSTKTNVQNHPVIKRLFQFRQLLLKLEPVFDEIMKPQIELILGKDSEADNTKDVKEKKKKTLKLLASLTKKQETNTKKTKKPIENNVTEDERPAKKVKFADEGNVEKKKEKLEESIEEQDKSDEDENVDENTEKDNGSEGKVFYLFFLLFHYNYVL